MRPLADAVEPASSRRIAALAFPALGVLAAEPVYLLFDLAVIGRLGALSLAGLAIGALVMGVLSSQLTFLSYGTTARAARFFGAGDRRAAVEEGVQATWLALGIGAAIVAAVQVTAVPLVSALAAGGDIADAAGTSLRSLQEGIRRQKGTTLSHMIEAIRLERFRAALTDPYQRGSVTERALAAGIGVLRSIDSPERGPRKRLD